MPLDSTTYYVYVLARPNTRVFYVGKGRGRRVFDHEREARSDCHCHKCNVIRKIWKQGGQVQRYTVFTTNDEAEAYTHEAELIALYGLGTLTNRDTGGQGGKKPNADTLARNRASCTTPEERARRSAQSKANWADPVIRERMIEGSRKTHQATASTPEARERNRAANIERWDDPAYRAEHTAAIKARYADPAYKAKHQEAHSAAKGSPEGRANASAAAKARWARDGERERQSERTVERHARNKAKGKL